MNYVWLVIVAEDCPACWAEPVLVHRELFGAFAREEDAVGYGLWLHCNDKVGGRQVRITRVLVAPPGSMYPPETVH